MLVIEPAESQFGHLEGCLAHYYHIDNNVESSDADDRPPNLVLELGTLDVVCEEK